MKWRAAMTKQKIFSAQSHAIVAVALNRGSTVAVLFVTALLSAAIASQAQPPPPSLYEAEEPLETDNRSLGALLSELNCKCSSDVGGLLCQDSVLDQFEEYEWTHASLVDFARGFRNLHRRLAERKRDFVLALQGEADSQVILDFKSWNVVDNDLGRRKGRSASDKVTNDDLAWLRSMAVFRALKRVLPAQEIRLLEPLEHTAADRKTGEYRATKIYILGFRKGCSNYDQ